MPPAVGEGIALEHSFRVEVRDSSLHDAVWPLPGGGGYAFSLAHGFTDAEWTLVGATARLPSDLASSLVTAFVE